MREPDWTITSAIEQIKACGFECQAGSLDNNQAWRWLLQQPSIAPDSPITVDELLARGVTDELEGRALDVVLRCGWPRPGDPLGIKPCIPLPVTELRAVVEAIDREEQGVKTKDKLKEVRVYLNRALRLQRYVMGLYLGAVDPPPELEEAGS